MNAYDELKRKAERAKKYEAACLVDLDAAAQDIEDRLYMIRDKGPNWLAAMDVLRSGLHNMEALEARWEVAHAQADALADALEIMAECQGVE